MYSLKSSVFSRELKAAAEDVTNPILIRWNWFLLFFNIANGGELRRQAHGNDVWTTCRKENDNLRRWYKHARCQRMGRSGVVLLWFISG